MIAVGYCSLSRVRRGRWQYPAAVVVAFALGMPPRATFAQPGAPASVTMQASNTKELLVGLHAVSDRVVWASGAGGTYLVTTDGGSHWRAGTVPGASSLQFRDVHALDSLTAWLLSIGQGDSSRVYHTTDGGAHWTLQFTNRDSTAFYDCFAFWDATHAIAISDEFHRRVPILLTADGGQHWDLLPYSAQPPADSAEGSPAASGTCVVARTPGHAWFGTVGSPRGARVFRSATGGRSWESVVTPIGNGAPGSNIGTLVFRDTLRGFAGGGGPTARVAQTTNGGRSWQLAGEPTFSGSVYGMAIVPGRPRTLVAVGPGGADVSADNGRSWQPVDAGNWWSVTFANSRTGWMVGPKGRVAQVRLR